MAAETGSAGDTEEEWKRVLGDAASPVRTAYNSEHRVMMATPDVAAQQRLKQGLVDAWAPFGFTEAEVVEANKRGSGAVEWLAAFAVREGRSIPNDAVKK